MSKTTVFKVEVGPFYIKAEDTEQVYDILWEQFGVEASQVEKITISDDQEYSDNKNGE